MESKIARFKQRKYLPHAIIGYLVYMLIIYTLGTTTFLIFGLIPLGLAFIVLEYRNIPYGLNNSRIFLNTTGFLFIQLWINFYLVISLILIQPNILSSDYSSQSFFVTWVISTAYCLGSILLNIFLGWKWTKYNLEKPYMLHWAIGYLFYFVIIGLGIIIIQILNPSVTNILLWPFSGIIIIGTLCYFITSFGLFIAGIEVYQKYFTPMGGMGQGDASITFAFIVVVGFFFLSVYLLFCYIFLFKLGAYLAKRNMRGNGSLKRFSDDKYLLDAHKSGQRPEE